MAEIEKKFSDFQESDCKEEKQIEVVDPRLCPTCIPNPEFKLHDFWWEIKEGYLNESVCEYHIRVYESEVKREIKNIRERGASGPAADDSVDTPPTTNGLASIELVPSRLEPTGNQKEVAISLGITNLLIDLNKPVNDQIRNQLIEAAFVKDTFFGTRSDELGTAYLIAVPAFNFDQIKPNNDENSEKSKSEMDNRTFDEFIVNVEGLDRKLKQLKLTLSVYEKYYSMIQSESRSFVIRREEDPTIRLNYGNIVKKINVFKNKLNEALRKSGYSRINRPGIFAQKRATRIKFTFTNKDNINKLDKILILPDDGCNEYKELIIPSGNPIKKPSMVVVYSFLENLDEVVNDFTAKETMPWSEWTIKHVYPPHVIDYGNVEDIPNIKSGMECLLEAQLGIGGGKLIDSLTKEVMSAFAKAEEEMQEQACKNREQRIRGSSTTYAQNKNKEPLTAAEEREAQMIERYTKEFKNKFLDSAIEVVKHKVPEKEHPKINRKNVLSYMPQLLTPIGYFTPKYNFKNTDGDKKIGGGNFIYIANEDDLKKYAKNYAVTKFNNLEDGSRWNQVQNSPHFQDARDSSLEVVKKFEDTYVDATKEVIDGLKDIELIDFIPTLGVCGFSKIAGKALECIANGVSFDDFLSILIDKTFDFMEVNTLSLFMNGLPSDFREDLNNELEKQFGRGVDLESLFNIKNAEGGSQKMKDFVKSKQVASRLKGLFEKYGRVYSRKATQEELNFINSELGENTINHFKVISAMKKASWDTATNKYKSKKIVIEGKEYRSEKYVIKTIRKIRREVKKEDKNFRKSVGRVYNAVSTSIKSSVDSIDENLAEFSEERKNLRDLRTVKKEFEKDKRQMEERLSRLIEQRRELQSLERPTEQIDQFIEQQYSELAPVLNELNLIQQDIDELNLVKQTFSAATDAILDSETFVTDPNEFERAAAAFQATALGLKVDAVFDIIFDFAIEYVIDSFDLDELFQLLRSYPAVDFALDKVEGLLKSCPTTPVIYPPPNEFLKSLTVDVCDSNYALTMPKINVSSINFRYNIERQFGEVFREAIINLVTDIVVRLLQRLMATLESSLCNLVEAAGGFVAEGIQEGNLGRSIVGLGNSFTDSLNEAFCNDGEDPNTSRKKAEQLADALFSPLSFDASQNFEGSGSKVANIISSVASKNELLSAMVARTGEEDSQFNKRISTAISTLAPEMEVLLGTEDQVAFFFSNLGSFLSPEDRKRIRDLLEAGIPNLPVSNAICLTNEQLDQWNELRKNLLSPNPDAQSIVDDLNDKTLTALEDIMDDVGDLQTDGPFLASLTNEALKDVCNPNNLFNDVSQSEFDKNEGDELIDAFYDNITRSLIKGFTGKNSILGEALADKFGKKEFGRNFLKIFNPNYQNSQNERDNKYNSRGRVGKFLMDITTIDDEAVGVYPQTVGISQRKKILDDSGKSYDFEKVKKGKKSSKNIVYRYVDEIDGIKYRVSIAASNLRRPKKTFGYNMQVIEKISDEREYSELSFNVPISITEEQNKLMESFGFFYKLNENQDIRKSAFNSFMNSKFPLAKNYDKIFEQTFEMINTNLVESLLTSEGGSVPNGYQFGYIDEELTKDSWEYTPSENENELGTFASPRIIPLDPKIYGGRYSNPAWYLEPRQFTGWVEIAVKAFDSQDGCDPKTPPLISFQDISNRTKFLSSQMRNDPRLSKSPECISLTPFNLLLDSKNKAKMDGVVRTTIRSYVAEYFIKGYGMFSNIEIRNENFDSSLFLYVTSKMKSEMMELGTQFSNRKIRIARERYWYTFLEQCVEAYQRTIDIDKVSPPDNIMDALMKIQSGLDKFVPINRKIKKNMRIHLQEGGKVFKPGSNYDPVSEVSVSPKLFGLQAVAFRLTTDLEERENFFNGEEYDDIKPRDIRFASLKKLKFFQKIYFIKLFEREATLIMSELIKEEVNRFATILNDGVTDKPYYRDLYKAFFGMNLIFADSSSKIGLNSYYINKQLNGFAETGEVPSVVNNMSSAPKAATNEPQLILESYVRFKDKSGIDQDLALRSSKYKNVVSLENASNFVDEYYSFLENKKLSDVFGDLKFVYSGSFKSLMSKGFANSSSLSKLIELNNDDETSSKIRDGYVSYVVGDSFDDFDVKYDEQFVLSGENPMPSGTIGSTGVSYGLRVCMVLPVDFIKPNDIQVLEQNNINELSLREKSYKFEDETFVIPLISEEVDLVDSTFEEFDPYSGIERYDLECLINKMVERDEFNILFDKIFNMSQASSMLAMYCIESLVPSIGRDEEERYAPDLIADADDAWDGTINKFAKNFLRREFKSIYLSNTEDGASPDVDDDEERGRLLNFGNPFNSFSMPSVKIPWWYRRRMRTKIYDANRVECVDPKKDLE